MIAAGLVELVLGVDAAQRSLEDIAKPLTAQDAEREGTGDQDRVGTDTRRSDDFATVAPGSSRRHYALRSRRAPSRLRRAPAQGCRSETEGQHDGAATRPRSRHASACTVGDVVTVAHGVDGVGQRQRVRRPRAGSRSSGRAAPAGRRAGTAAARTPAGTAQPGTRGCERADEQAESHAEHRVEDGDDHSSQVGPADVEAEEGHRERWPPRCLDDGDQAEGQRVAEQEVELADRHGEQALERAGRALAQGGDRGDEEHHHEREDAEQRGTDAVEGRRAVEDPGQQRR